MQTHSLDAINAALRLGDPAVPPKGSRLAFVSGRRRGFVMTSLAISYYPTGEAPFPVHAYRRERLERSFRVRLQSGRSDLVRPHEVKVLELPDDSPPFEDWIRLPWEGHLVEVFVCDAGS